MSLRRGDLVTVSAKGAYTGKPRPALVIQPRETLSRLARARLPNDPPQAYHFLL